MVTLLVFVVSCTGPAYLRTKTGKIKHLCNAPIFYAYDNTVDPSHMRAIEDGMDYWNVVLGTRMFLYGGTDISAKNSSRDLLIFSEVKDLKGHCGIAFIHSKGASGCTSSMNIVLDKDCMDPLRAETLVRHEVGHILGLANTDNPEHLMMINVLEHFKIGATEPIEADDSEIEAIKELYDGKN